MTRRELLSVMFAELRSDYTVFAVICLGVFVFMYLFVWGLTS